MMLLLLTFISALLCASEYMPIPQEHSTMDTIKEGGRSTLQYLMHPGFLAVAGCVAIGALAYHLHTTGYFDKKDTQ